jgi:hypothetical protein
MSDRPQVDQRRVRILKSFVLDFDTHLSLWSALILRFRTVVFTNSIPAGLTMGFNTIDCGCQGIENGLIIGIERRIILADMSVVCIQELYMLIRKS